MESNHFTNTPLITAFNNQNMFKSVELWVTSGTEPQTAAFLVVCTHACAGRVNASVYATLFHYSLHDISKVLQNHLLHFPPHLQQKEAGALYKSQEPITSWREILIF